METRQIRQRSILGSSWKIYCQHKLRRFAEEFVCLSVPWSVSTESDLLSVWDFKASVLKSSTAFSSSRPSHQVKHNCQTVRFADPPCIVMKLTQCGHEGKMGFGISSAVVAKPGLLPALHGENRAA